MRAMRAMHKMHEMVEMKETKESRNRGFTLVEVMAVMIIVAVMAAIAIPKLASSSDTARRNADIATGHEVKAALDRYQVENGVYPTLNEIGAAGGALTFANFIPKYISKLDTSTTQQKAVAEKRGFDEADISTINGQDQRTRLIMLYLTADGSAAEVQVYSQDLTNVLWTSAL